MLSAILSAIADLLRNDIIGAAEAADYLDEAAVAAEDYEAMLNRLRDVSAEVAAMKAAGKSDLTPEQVAARRARRAELSARIQDIAARRAGE